MKEAASILYNQTKILEETLDSICLGEGECGKCSGTDCLLGYTRFILKEARKKDDYCLNISVDIDSLIKKKYDKDKVIEALAIIVADSNVNEWDLNQYYVINKIKDSLEIIIFNDVLHDGRELSDYIYSAKLKNHKYGVLLEENIQRTLNNLQ